MNRLFALGLGVGLIAMLPMKAIAQASSDVPTPEELIEALLPDLGVSRGLTPVDEEETQTPSTPQGVVDLSIQFEFDSAELTPTSAATLTSLAEALRSDSLQPFEFMIEGHTDASGSASYNEDLSARRAMAVFDHLTTTYGLEEGRFAWIGKGEAELLPNAAPNSALNRRVRIRNLSGG